MKGGLAMGLIAVVGSVGLACADVSAMIRDEMQAFSAQVAPCWNIDSLDQDEPPAEVTVAFELRKNAVPVAESLRLIGAGKDTSPEVLSAYHAARRAIIRCGGKGYKLPLEKYAQWKSIELTFNPERMSLR